MTYTEKAREIAQKLRDHIQSRGGFAKDETGKPVGTIWPLMIEAADTLEALTLIGAEREAIGFGKGKEMAAKVAKTWIRHVWDDRDETIEATAHGIADAISTLPLPPKEK